MAKKVLQVLYKADFGGAEECTRLLIEHCDFSKYKGEVCFLHTYGPMVERFKQSGINVTTINMKHGLDIIGALRYYTFIKKNKFDIIHIQIPNILTMAVSYFFCPHVIGHIHMGRIADIKGLKKFMLKFFFKKFDKLIAVCKSIEKIMISYYNIAPEKICTVHNGIDLTLFNITINKNNYLNSLNIKYDNQTIIGFAGRLIPLKQCGKLLQMISSVPKETDFLLLIAGDGPQINYLKNLSEKLNLNNKVFFLGARNDINKFFNILDIFVLTSEIEAFPRVVQEAMASKVPVVSFDVGGVSEVIRNNQDGFLINPNDFKTFREKLLLLIKNKNIRKKMGASALQRAQSFSMDKTVKEIYDVYDRILSA